MGKRDVPSVLPTGKLPPEVLQALLERSHRKDPRLITGPRVGEDVAVIDMGSRYMVVKTDPITFATDQIGWYAVHVNANDVATSGATPRWMLATLLLPEHHTTQALVETIFRQLTEACASLDITLVGGHTEVTYGLSRPIVVGVLIGEVEKERLITSGGAQVGDQVLLVKGIPIEATALIAHERGDDLRRRGYSEAFIARARDYLYDPGISVVGAARVVARHPGVHAMHDPTEGGLATGLHELAFSAGTGAVLYAERVPILAEGRRLCDEYGLDPLGALASGALIVAVSATHARTLEERLRSEGYDCAHVADLLPAAQGVSLSREGRLSPLPRYDADEVTKVF